ncbi:MAG: hypothetical protein JW958_12965 [Candidatus Eisenbacteria bacterium]|nr:hypothetical protein [Candidatus Eisenbacteria bacterium]
MRIPVHACCAVLVLLPFLFTVGCGGDDPGSPEGNGGAENDAPAIAAFVVNPPILRPGEGAALACVAVDPDGDSLTYAWGAAAGTYADSTNTGNEADWIAPGVEGTVDLWVTVSDGEGESDADTVAVEVVAGTFLTRTNDGITALDFSGNGFVLSESRAFVEVLGTRIFLKDHASITEIDHQGNTVDVVPVAAANARGYDWFIHPDGGFTFLDNATDSIFCMSVDGSLAAALAMPDSSPDELQSLDGVVVGGHAYISETGNSQLIDLDLTTLTATIFREIDPTGGWLGAIDYGNGAFSLGRSKKIHRFTAEGDVTDLCTLPAGNITGLATAGSYIYAVVNFSGELYRIHSVTGEYAVVADSLNYPKDLEFLPAVLESPAVAP